MQQIAVSDKCGVIFDMDGVVVDTTEAHYQAWVWASKQLDQTMSREHFMQGFGRRNIDILKELSAGRHSADFIEELDLEKEKRYRELFAKCSTLIPGIVETLKWLKKYNVPVALGTSAPKQNVDDVYDLWDLKQYFTKSVCAECVVNGKPHPEVFETAAARIERTSEQCIVFEDSNAGIKAAVASGAETIAVLNDNDKDAFANFDIKASIVNFNDLEWVYDQSVDTPYILKKTLI